MVKSEVKLAETMPTEGSTDGRVDYFSAIKTESSLEDTSESQKLMGRLKTSQIIDTNNRMMRRAKNQKKKVQYSGHDDIIEEQPLILDLTRISVLQPQRASSVEAKEPEYVAQR